MQYAPVIIFIATMDFLLSQLETFQFSPEEQQEFVKRLQCLIQPNDIKYIKLKTPSDISCVNHLSMLYKEQKCFNNLDFLVNIFPNNIATDIKNDSIILCGNLMISHYHGHFLLYDNATYIHVRFTNTVSNLSIFDNTFVLITKYTLFTEITMDEKYVPLEYILVDDQDVWIVLTNIQPRKIRFYDKNSTCNPGFSFIYLISIKKISGVLFGHQGKSECYIEASVSAPTFNGVFVAFLIIPEELLTVSRFLKTGVVYRIHSKSSWSSANMCFYPELRKHRTANVVLHIDPDSMFHETTLTPHNPQNDLVLTSFNQIKHRIATATDYDTISFQLPIFKKSMKAKAFAPYFPARHKCMPYFGDIGNTEQTLVFREEQQFIDLYLTNRDNHVVELGLVENIVVRVNHAQVLKKRYVKATIFTTFDIIKYCPSWEFTSSMFRIHPEYGLSWYDEYPANLLGCFNEVPVGCVVGGSVFFNAILDLSINVINRENKPQVEVHMILDVYDGVSDKFRVELECLEFLLDVLGWSCARSREAFMQECFSFDGVRINFLKISSNDAAQLKNSSKVLDKVVWLVYDHINFHMPLLMHLLCLRQPDRDNWKPYKVVCCKSITKMTRYPRLKLSSVLFPKCN